MKNVVFEERLFSKGHHCIVLGGPHVWQTAEWVLSSAVLCRMGFAILQGKSLMSDP